MANKFLISIASTLVFSLAMPISASGADSLTILAVTPYTAQISGVGSIWKGSIPTSFEYPIDGSFEKLEFPIQGILPYSVLADRATGVSVEFEIWSEAGKKLGSTSIYSASWNPVGPNTLISMYVYSGSIGKQTMIVRTLYTLRTNGLLSSYLKQEDRFEINIVGKKVSQTLTFNSLKNRTISEGSFTLYSVLDFRSSANLIVDITSDTPNICTVNALVVTLVGVGTCSLRGSQSGTSTIAAASPVTSSFQVAGSKPAEIKDFSASMSGGNISYKFSKPISSSPILKYEVIIQRLLYPGLSLTAYASYSPYTVIRTITDEQFTLSSEEIKNYLVGEQVTDITKSSIMVRMRAYNDLGASDWSSGIYTETSRFGWKSASQEASDIAAAAALQATLDAISAAQNVKTITCVKGKLTKKIRSANPKCPAGYKKK